LFFHLFHNFLLTFFFSPPTSITTSFGMANTPTPSDQFGTHTHRRSTIPCRQRSAKRFSKLIPHITLSRRQHQQPLAFEGPEPDVRNLAIGYKEDSSDDDNDDDDDDDDDDGDEISLEFYSGDHISAYSSVNHKDLASENRYIDNSIFTNSAVNNDPKALLEFCPYSLTYAGRKCPLGDECILKKICYANGNGKKGCRREDCERSHEHVVTCRYLLKHGHCKQKGCQSSHDIELRKTIKESIDDHVVHRKFGVRVQDGDADEIKDGDVDEGEGDFEVEEITREDDFGA
jgi:hypothetical protein